MFVIGSRGSDLALAQAKWTQQRILSLSPDIEVSIRIIKTSGDKDTVTPIRSGSSVGVFVKELERALLNQEIDLAVHSMKDLPTQIRPELTIAAIPEREDVRDAFVSLDANNLSTLPPGAKVGTGSIRRQAQLLAIRPDLQVVDIRGNINTRLRKLDEKSYDAVILACAGLNRLDFQNRITERFTLDQMLPAPGQGALAIQTRSSDSRVLAVATALDHRPTSIAVRAERSFLRHVGGGCNVPVAAFARMETGHIRMDGLIISPDGRTIIRESLVEKPEAADTAACLLADRLLDRGGRSILDAL